MNPAQQAQQNGTTDGKQSVPQPFSTPKQQLNPVPLSGTEEAAKSLADILLEQGAFDNCFIMPKNLNCLDLE